MWRFADDKAMLCTESKSMDTLFRKSSTCASNECVLVAGQADGGVLIKGGSHRPDRALRFSREEWRAFTEGVKLGEFDVE
jgi:hypothetical protein